MLKNTQVFHDESTISQKGLPLHFFYKGVRPIGKHLFFLQSMEPFAGKKDLDHGPDLKRLSLSPQSQECL